MAPVHDMFLHLMCARMVTDPDDGEAIIDRFVQLTPEWAPRTWGHYEPFEPADLTKVRSWWRSGLMWEGAGRGSSKPGGSFFAMPGTHFPSVEVRSPAGLVDGERAGRLLRELAVLIGGVYGFVHRLTPGDLATTERRSASINSLDGPQMNTAGLFLAQTGLPNVWWANIFGPPVVDLLGADRIATAPAHLVEQLGDDLWYLQLTESILDNETDPDGFEAARAAVKAHLGADAFYDPAKGADGPYRTIRLPPPIPVPRDRQFFLIEALGPPGFTQQPDIRARWEPWAHELRPDVWEVDLPADALAELVPLLPADNRTTEVNEIPPLEAFARIADQVPFARFSGKVVGPGGGTEGVIIEQLWVPDGTDNPTVTHIAPTASTDTADPGGRTLWWT